MKDRRQQSLILFALLQLTSVAVAGFLSQGLDAVPDIFASLNQSLQSELDSYEMKFGFALKQNAEHVARKDDNGQEGPDEIIKGGAFGPLYLAQQLACKMINSLKIDNFLHQ